MKQLLVFIFLLVLMTAFTDTSPILTEKEAKQILRTRREDRQRKAGFPDEPMREPKRIHLAVLAIHCFQHTHFFVNSDGHNKRKLSQEYYTKLVNNPEQLRLYDSTKKPADLFMGVEEDTYCDCAKDKIVTALAMCSL